MSPFGTDHTLFIILKEFIDYCKIWGADKRQDRTAYCINTDRSRPLLFLYIHYYTYILPDPVFLKCSSISVFDTSIVKNSVVTKTYKIRLAV